MMQKGCLLFGFATCALAPLQLFALMWSRADIIGLFSINVGPILTQCGFERPFVLN
jgi:hypothetical protein